MTEGEWEALQEPWALIRSVTDRPMQAASSSRPNPHLPSERKMRLFGCLCARYFWHELEPGNRATVELAERFSDGQADAVTPKAAKGLTQCRNHPQYLAWLTTSKQAITIPASATRYLADQPANQLSMPPEAQADAWRDLIGNPFGASAPLVVPRSEQIISLAQAAYEERQEDSQCRHCRGQGHVREDGPYSDRWNRVECGNCSGRGILRTNGRLEPLRLSILADALEEAECLTSDLLAHLRSKKPHYRGCWALDKVLEQE